MTGYWPNGGQATSLPGGDGSHGYRWAVDGSGTIFGLVEYHAGRDGKPCGVWVPWRQSNPAHSRDVHRPRYRLVMGGPGEDQEMLTITPAIRCGRCGAHGSITAGQWFDVDATRQRPPLNPPTS